MEFERGVKMIWNWYSNYYDLKVKKEIEYRQILRLHHPGVPIS